MYATLQNINATEPVLAHNPDAKFMPSLFLPENVDTKGYGGLRFQGKFKINSPDRNLITVITVVFNGEKFLEETILSVLNQTYDNVEYIIIDGGSTDGSVEIIKKYEHAIDYWVSEKDTGIYEAMNKGISLAQGLIIGLINADDFYQLQHFENIVTEFHKTNCDILYGDTARHSLNGTVDFSQSSDTVDIPKGLTFFHTSIVVRRDVYTQIGLFNTNFKIAGDIDWLLRAWNVNKMFSKGSYFVNMRLGGISDKQFLKARKEHSHALLLNGYKKIPNISIVYSVFRRKIGIFKLGKVKTQLIFILIFMVNCMMKYSPSHFLKKRILGLLSIQIGNRSYLHSVKIFGFKNMQIGDHCVINSGCYLDNRKNIKIGNNVSISHDSKIYTLGHDINHPYFITHGRDVIIEDYVVIFSNVLIMPGTHLKKGCVCYPGSVVTGIHEENSILAGNPARQIGIRTSKQLYTIDYSFIFAL
jgi:acetyltransferase-like isoleucine patch superfamily enzyme